MTLFQKNIKCLKCGKSNCIQFPDKDDFNTCVYCGGTQNIKIYPQDPKDLVTKVYINLKY